uniref:SSD domain-containing protein n=1 Tax=Bicosoecida sp. CB-2014 TaxID=1486930 RepID=A0A7S1C4Y0_9STRA
MATPVAKEASGHPDPHRSNHCTQIALRRMARLIVDYPCRVALGSLLCIFIIIGIVSTATIAIDAGGSSFRAETDSTALNFDAVTVATLDVILPPKAADVEQPERALPYGSVSLIYEAPAGADTGSMLGLTGLRAICEKEQAITSTADFRKFCLRGEGGKTCATPVSVLSLLFDADAETGLLAYDCAGITQADVDGLVERLTDAPESIVLAGTGLTQPINAAYLLPSNFGPSDTNAAVTRSLMVFGLPLAGYNNADQPSPTMKGVPLMRASAEQSGKVDAWTKDVLLPVLDDASDDVVAVRFRGTGINDVIFEGILLNDVNYVMLSLVFVFAYCWFHMRSLSLTAAGLFGVIMSLPVAVFVYAVVLQIDKFGTLNFLGLFVILGIGADDLFLFRDAYVQMGSAMEAAEARGFSFSADDRKYARMEAAYSRSATAMAITTLTTALSFAGNAVSIIPPVRSFGIFTSVLVVVNYLIVITWFPACVVGIEWLKASRCGTRKLATQDGDDSGAGDVELAPAEDAGTGAGGDADSDDGGARARALSITSNDPDTHENATSRALERFFGGPHARFVTEYAKPIVGAFFVFVVLCIVAATQVETSKEPAQFLPEDHEFWRSVLLRDRFEQPSRAINDASGGNTLPGSVEWEAVFGVAGISKDNLDPTDASDLGDVIWSTTWDISDTAAQAHMLQLCDAAEAELSDLAVESVSACFVRDVKAWLEDGRGLTWPLPADRADDTVALIAEWFNAQGPPYANPYAQQIGFSSDQSEVRFAKLLFQTGLAPFTPSAQVEPVYDEIDAFVAAQNAKPGAAHAQAIQNSFWWMIMRTESVLVDTAILCASVSVALAFCLLLAATRNVIITIASTLCILCVVATVLAFMYVAGWELGIIESINLTVLVGISVDYTVHLAVAYGLHAHGDRRTRMRLALEHMAISVFSAAITTIGSALFLCLAVVLFFVRFGIFISVTLTASLVFAFLLFPAIMVLVGPEDEAEGGGGGTGDDAVDVVIQGSMKSIDDEEAAAAAGAANGHKPSRSAAAGDADSESPTDGAEDAVAADADAEPSATVAAGGVAPSGADPDDAVAADADADSATAAPSSLGDADATRTTPASGAANSEGADVDGEAGADADEGDAAAPDDAEAKAGDVVDDSQDAEGADSEGKDAGMG